MFAYLLFALTRQQLKTENNKLNIYTQYLTKSTFETIWLFFHRRVGLVELLILYATGFGLPSYFEDCVFNYLLPDNDGVDDFLKSLAIPAQETCSNVPISKSMWQFPVPMITNCQNITINYNIFPRKWLSFMSLHTFLFYCYSCWIDCLLLKFGSYKLYYFDTENILGSYYGMAQSSSVHILFPSYFSSSFQ